MTARIALVFPEPWGVEEEADSVVDPAFRFTTRVSESGDTVMIYYEYASLRDWVPAEGLKSYASNVDRARDLVGIRIPHRPAGPSWLVMGAGFILLFVLAAAGAVALIVIRVRRRARTAF